MATLVSRWVGKGVGRSGMGMSDRSIGIMGVAVSILSAALCYLLNWKPVAFVAVELGVALSAWAVLRDHAIGRRLVQWRTERPVISTVFVAVSAAIIFGGGWLCLPSSNGTKADDGKGQETQRSADPSPPTSQAIGAKETVPDFKISIVGGNVFVPDADPSLTGIALLVRIRNAGSPSIATDWAALLTVPGEQRPVMAQLTAPPPRLTLSGSVGTTVLTAADFSLERQTAGAPLKAGDPPVQGWLLFYLALPKSKVMNPSTVIRVEVSDFAGRPFSATQRQGDWLAR